MYCSDIDSMYQKMNQTNVTDRTAEEVKRAATITGANSFFIVVGDTSLGNEVDQAFLFNSESGLDPADQNISQFETWLQQRSCVSSAENHRHLNLSRQKLLRNHR
jgi:hypothetical protein